ncbi:MAG: serine/threonine protein kinase [Symploca sp. SIO2B6]|nr:serine/threonine protein kinase [Symploca sp. SIO2B6]
MNLDSLLAIVNRKLLESSNRPLNSAETMVLRGIWQHQTYSEIAHQEGYSSGYFTNVVPPELYRRLSNLIGRRVNKKNCRVLLESYAATQELTQAIFQGQEHAPFSLALHQALLPPYPSGSIPLNSPFYIEHYCLEQQIYQEISKPGALVRIKAPGEMGKTSLLLRILEYANNQSYRTVSLNLEQVDEEILNNTNRLLRWLCAHVTEELKLQPQLDDYWDEDIGSKVSCSLYFRSYLLEQIDPPLVLVLDEVNQIFEHPQVAKDFLSLLRSWYEEAKRLPIWQQLRLVIAHSTEVYVPLQLNHSPFNVGLAIQLTAFNLEQIQQLAQRYQLNWSEGEQAQQLMAMVGGHPALVHTALYHLSRGELTLAQLLKEAPTSSGIYHHHLQRHLATIQEQPTLAQALGKVLNAGQAVNLEPILAYKLSSMGLIYQSGNGVSVSCELYRQYFTQVLHQEMLIKN